ncbi:TRAP transporter substrate-binding protein DctP, partial [Testudinibacter aquarius]
MKLLKTLITCSILAFSASSGAATYNWNFQSSDQPGDDAFKFQQQWAKDVEELSDGKIHINVLGAGAVVEHNQTLESIGMNILQGDFTDPSYFSGKDPAFALYGNLIGAWNDPKDLVDFIYNGGGFDVANELLNKYGVELLAVSTVGVESLVAKKPIHNIEELQGVKVRAPEGLVQVLFKNLGASPVNLPGSEVYTSLEKGVIDASDYSIFARNEANGMNDIAKYPI